MAEVIPLAKTGAGKTASVGGLVMTESARDILRSLELVNSQFGGAITLISAAPGTGKTAALMHFKRTVRPDALFHTAVAEEDDTPWGVACQLMETLDLGMPNNRNLRASRLEIANTIGVDGLLIVDEAQNLIRRNPRGGTDWTTLEWCRAMAEEGCFSLVFCGDLVLADTAQRLPQLWRRMRRRVVIKEVSERDVTAFVASRGFSEPRIVKALYEVARRGGGLGDVENVLSHAPLLAGGDEITAAHIQAAIIDLKLGPKGWRQ